MILHAKKHAPRILIVDDNPDIRDVLAGVFKRYNLAFAFDGEQGLEAARETRPDLVILDLMMPKLDGFGFLAAAKDDPALRHLRVLVLSAKTLKDDMLKGYDLGAVDYVTKPFNRELLRIKAERLLELRFAAEVAEHQLNIIRYMQDVVGNIANVTSVCAGIFRDMGSGRYNDVEMTSVNVLEETSERAAKLLTYLTTITELSHSHLAITGVPVSSLLFGVKSRIEEEVRNASTREIANCDAFKNRSLAVNIPDNDLPPISGHPGHLSTALWMLAENAIAHTDPGDEIGVTAKQDGADISILVHDTGPGVPEKFIPNMFRLVDARAASGSSRHFGLGLPLARLIARACGGDLSYRREGRRSLFTMTLPVMGTIAPPAP